MPDNPSAPSDGPKLSKSVIRIHAQDTALVALNQVFPGDVMSTDLGEIHIHEEIQKGHKIALTAHKTGQVVYKYGYPIGLATTDIMPGDHIHTHNLKSALDEGQAYIYAPKRREVTSKPLGWQFQGYRRANGAVGIRNEIWILCTVGCVADTALRLAAKARERFKGRVDGIYGFAHQFGCSQLGDDLNATRQLLTALAEHPNAAGILVIGLGCENNQIKALIDGINDRPAERLAYFNAQQVGDEIETGLEALEGLVRLAEMDRRETCDLSDLCIGVKCGGSDGFSGLSANPLVGRISDIVTLAGGQVILSEIPEMFGAEQTLLDRCETPKVFEALSALVVDFKHHFTSHNLPVFENPSPGNKAGGITTLEEKSLGAVQKSGQAIVTEVIAYGQRAHQKGLIILEAPGNDAVSTTAMIAAGAVMVLFTTGRGTPLGFAAPCLKIASNSALAEMKPGWIDFDAGRVLQSGDTDGLTRDLMDLIEETANGAPCKSEIREARDLAIWKRGVTL